MPDDAFVHDGQITKHGIRAVTLAALAPRPGERLWDVGAGSGSIVVEWCLSWRGCSAVAFERDERRRLNVGFNAAAFGVSIDVRGEAPDAFDGAEPPSAIFIGGGLTQPGLLDACLDNLPAWGTAGRQRGHRGIGSRSRTILFTPRWPAATLPALSGRAAGRLHRLAPAACRSPSGR